MATDKTPAHKRISRAENSVAHWKTKAIERREAVEALKEQLATASENVQIKIAELAATNKRCASLEKQLRELSGQLKLANQVTVKLQTEMSEFKKKLSR
jgi:chromosome segregation ATPase